MINPPRQAVTVHTAKLNQEKHPDLDGFESVVLKDTPRVRRIATHAAIRDRHTGKLHHHSINIKTFRRKKGEETEDEAHSVTIEGEDEIHKLSTLLLKVRQGVESEGIDSFVVVNKGTVLNHGDLQQLLNRCSTKDKAAALMHVLQTAVQDPAVFSSVVERAATDPTLFVQAATTLNLAAFKSAVNELKILVATPNVKEGKFQEVLGKNPWLFGSEYSELLDRRRWTRDENQDFVVRRTTDGYIELIEIKTPLNGAALFNHDTSHDSYYPAAELSRVLGQVQKYIAKLDADRNAILVNDGEDTSKIRAKIVIGHDGDEKQLAALRTLNGHLHRIEIITFDQLLRTAQCTISYLEKSLNSKTNTE